MTTQSYGSGSSGRGRPWLGFLIILIAGMGIGALLVSGLSMFTFARRVEHAPFGARHMQPEFSQPFQEQPHGRFDQPHGRFDQQQPPFPMGPHGRGMVEHSSRHYDGFMSWFMPFHALRWLLPLALIAGGLLLVLGGRHNRRGPTAYGTGERIPVDQPAPPTPSEPETGETRQL